MNPTTLKTRHGVPLIALAAVAMVVVCTACSPPVVKQYAKDGVQFSYYSNWKIIKDAPVNGKPDVRAIHVEGPDHAVVSFICVPPASTQTLEQFAGAVAKNRNAAIEAKLSVGGIKTAEVSQGTSEPTTDKVAGQDRTGILQRFSIDLLGQQVPHIARFYVVEGSKYRILVMSQVATEKAVKNRTGSELILSSLSIEL